MQPHPGAERAELAREIGDVAPHLPPAPVVRLVPAVGAVGRGVLADDEKLAHPGGDQPLGFAQDRMRRPRHQLPAHVGDDAEAALVVTALGDLEIAVVPRRELHRARRQQVDVGIGRRRHRGVHRVDHRLVLLRTRHREHGRMRAADVALVGAEAAGHDHPAVLGQRLADRLEAFGLGRIEKAAGVDDHRVGAGVVGRDRVALGAQPGQDALAVDQRLRAAEAHHPHPRLAGAHEAVEPRRRRAVRAQVGRVGAHRLRIASGPAGGKPARGDHAAITGRSLPDGCLRARLTGLPRTRGRR